MESDSALFDQFLFETKKKRKSFIELLEEKYVRNQDLCDVICVQTLQIVKDKGHLKKIKQPIEFGTISEYNCKTGRKMMKILKRRIRINRRIHVYEIDASSDKCSETDSSSSFDIKPCVVELTKLHLNRNRKCISKIKEQQKQKECTNPLDFKNQLKCVNNKTALLKDVSLTPNNKYSPISENNLTICDLSFKRLKRFDQNVHKNKSSKYFHNNTSPRNYNRKYKDKLKRHNLYMEFEEKIKVDEYCSYDIDNSDVSKKFNYMSYSFDSANKLTNFNFTDLRVVDKNSTCNNHLHSKNMVYSKLSPLPTPKISPNYSIKRSVPTYFEALLKQI